MTIPPALPDERQQIILERLVASRARSRGRSRARVSEPPRTRSGATCAKWRRRANAGASTAARCRFRRPRARWRRDGPKRRSARPRSAAPPPPWCGRARSCSSTPARPTPRSRARLPAGLGVIVATNAPDIAGDLVGKPGVELIVIGGRVDPRSGAALGARALRDAREIRVDLAFLGACAVDARAGVAAFDAEEAEFKRLVAERRQGRRRRGDDRQARNGGALRGRAGLAAHPSRRRSGRAGRSVGAAAPRRRQRPSRRARRRGEAMSGGVASRAIGGLA